MPTDVCPACDSPIEPGDVFCHECGGPIEIGMGIDGGGDSDRAIDGTAEDTAIDKALHCPNCGEALDGGPRCQNCGHDDTAQAAEEDNIGQGYEDAYFAMTVAKNSRDFQAAATLFATIPGYRDADALAEKCLEAAMAFGREEPFDTDFGEDGGSGPEVETEPPSMEMIASHLEDKKWKEAGALLSRLIGLEPENAWAYIGKLLVKLEAPHVGLMADRAVELDIILPLDANYLQAMKFADPEYRSILEGYEHGWRSRMYQKAVSAMGTVKTIREHRRLARIFKSISGYEEAKDFGEKAIKRARQMAALRYAKWVGIPSVAAVLLYLFLAPIISDAALKRGVAFKEQKNLGKALTYHSVAILVKPGNAAAYTSRGMVYSELKNYEKAIKDYSKAIELTPNNAEIYSSRGLAYINNENFRMAIEDYSTVIKLRPSSAKAYYFRGLLYYKINDYDNAIENYTHVIQLYPKDADLYKARGEAFRSKGGSVSIENAINDYTTAIQINPKDAVAYGKRGDIYYYNRSSYSLAIDDYAAAMICAESGSKSVYRSRLASVFNSRAYGHYNRRDYDSAIGDYLAAIELGNNSGRQNLADCYFHLGNFRLENGYYTMAIQYYDEALKYSNDSAIYYNRNLAARALERTRQLYRYLY